MTDNNDIDYANASGELLQMIEVWEGINADKKEVSDRLKEHKAECKARGYDTKIMNMVVKLRARDRAAIEEEEALLETYKTAVGMD